MSSLAFFLMVLYISAYSIRCLLSPCSTISRRFEFRARGGDHTLDFCGLLIALVTLDALCWITSVMASLMVSMSSSSCSVSNRFIGSSWNSIFFDPICATSTLGGLLVINFSLSTSMPNLTLLIAVLWSLAMLTWLMTVTSVTMPGLFIRMKSISAFFTPFELFHVHLLPAFFWNMVFMILHFTDVAHSTEVLTLSLFNSSPNLPAAVSIGFVLFHIFHICALKCSGLVSLNSHQRCCKSYYVFFWVRCRWCIYLHYL